MRARREEKQAVVKGSDGGFSEQEAMVEKGVPSLATLIADRGGERMQVVPGTLQETKGKIKGNQIATRMEVISVTADGAAEDERWVVAGVGQGEKSPPRTPTPRPH